MCRIIEKENSNESDEKILERYNNSHINQIEFLSHSYFGEQNNVLHFQHQSFAEILLAEYYIKVIIKFALDRNFKIEQVISKLMLGVPTQQTTQFFSEILVLLRETVSERPTKEIIEKRKLIFPLLASISIDTNNPSLYSDHLFYEWYNKGRIAKETTDIPETLIVNWCINSETIKAISNLCKQIIECDSIVVLSKSSEITNLFDNELTLLKNKFYKNSLYIPKFLCLIIGNNLTIEDTDTFIRSIEQEVIIELLNEELDRNQTLFKQQFKGLYLGSEKESPVNRSSTFVSDLRVDGYDFSQCEFERVVFFDCQFRGCYLNDTIFDGVIFYNCDFEGTKFDNAILKGLFFPINTSFGHGLRLPSNLLKNISRYHAKNNKDFSNDFFDLFRDNFIDDINFKIIIKDEGELKSIISSYQFFFDYGIRNGCFTINDVLSNFQFHKDFTKEGRSRFIESISNTTVEKTITVEEK